MGNAHVVAIPKLDAKNVDAALIHEAAIGKIAGDQLIKLMSLGLTEEEAEAGRGKVICTVLGGDLRCRYQQSGSRLLMYSSLVQTVYVRGVMNPCSDRNDNISASVVKLSLPGVS